MSKPILVFSRDGRLRGHTTGHTKPCTLEGCRGERVRVKWPDGKITWPCSKGMERLPSGFQIR